MVTISTKVLKGCREIDMSVILFPQSNITARWSADLNLTSPQEEEGENWFLVKSSQPVFHLCSIHRLKHLVVSGLQNSKSTDVSLRDQHIIYQWEGDREDKDKVISLIIMAQYFYGDGAFWRRYHSGMREAATASLADSQTSTNLDCWFRSQPRNWDL